MIKKKCIVITRPQLESQRTAQLLEKIGFETFIEPTISIEIIASTRPELLSAAGTADAIIVTSLNALRALQEFQLPACIPIVLVGQEASLRAKEYGFVNTELAGENVDALCGYTKLNYPGKKLVYASGVNITKELSAMNCGADVTRIMVYKTIPKEKLSVEFKHKLVNGEFYGISFFSSKNAEIFCELLKKENMENYIKPIFAFCLSEKIAEYIKKYGFKATIYPENANLDAFSKLLSNFDLHK